MATRRPGFSFLELLMGVFILFLVATSSLELFVAASRYSLHAREEQIASLLVQSKVEALLSIENTTSPTEELESFGEKKLEQGHFDDPYANYQYTVQIDDDELPLKTVQVTVIAPSGARASLRLLR